MPVIEVRQTEVFARWLANLRDDRARARVNARIRRLSIGNPGDTKSGGRWRVRDEDRLRSRLPRLFRPSRRSACDLTRRWRQANAKSRYRDGDQACARSLGQQA